MRIRFIGPDGVSFFEKMNVSPGRNWILRARIPEISWDASTRGSGANLAIVREVYERELWYVPIGPLACPIAAPHGPPGARDELDVVYRYKNELT